jgi:hypothetical protein
MKMLRSRAQNKPKHLLLKIFFGRGGGTRTPDTRIMMPGLSDSNQRLDLASSVKPALEDQKLSGVLSNRLAAAGDHFGTSAPRVDLTRSQRTVRQSDKDVRPPTSPSPSSSPLAHPSNRRIAQLNKSWRVMDDPLQWVLQRRKGNPRKKNSGWQDRSFCTTREALLRCIREYCGDVDQNALADLQALPEHHADAEQPE